MEVHPIAETNHREYLVVAYTPWVIALQTKSAGEQTKAVRTAIPSLTLAIPHLTAPSSMIHH